MDDIRLKPCPVCGGAPVVLIYPSWPASSLVVECITCRNRSPVIMFKGSQELLPDLATARRQAAALWNEGEA